MPPRARSQAASAVGTVSANARSRLLALRRKWRREGYTVGGTTSCAITLVGCMLLFVSILAIARPKPARIKGCDTATCNLYADVVKFSLQTGVEPCNDYYQHVCGGWLRQRRESVREAMLTTFATRVTQLAQRLIVPAHFQTPRERAAMAYTACADTASKYAKVDDVKSALQLVGLMWPLRGATANALLTLLSLTRNWGAIFLICVHKVSKRRYVIGPTDRYRDIALIREKAYKQMAHEVMFNELRYRYGGPGGHAGTVRHAGAPRERDLARATGSFLARGHARPGARRQQLVAVARRAEQHAHKPRHVEGRTVQDIRNWRGPRRESYDQEARLRQAGFSAAFLVG
ncbi:hypothetical protein MTO96_032521 [Rhipicephalus appendiculatus]